MNNSILKGIRLVELLTQSGKPMPLKDLAGILRLHKATAHRLLGSLCEGGVVQKIGEHGHYALGPACLAFAEGFRKRFTMADKVLPYLEKLVSLTSETAIYCERYRRDYCVTVERWDGAHETRSFSGTGMVRPLTAGSSAMAILAMLPREELLSVIESKPLIQYTPYTPKTAKDVLRKIEEIKRRGYAVNMRERDLDTGGIAAPVFNNRAVIGSLAVIGPVDRMKRSGFDAIGQKVQKVADEFSREIGVRVGHARSVFAGTGRLGARIREQARPSAKSFESAAAGRVYSRK